MAFRAAQRLAHQLQPVQRADGGQHVRAVGALPPTRLEQAALSCGVQHAGQQALSGLVLEQAAPELAQHAVVEPGIGQVEGEQVLPVDPAPNGVGRLPVAQPLPELHERDQCQAPRGISRLAERGIQVGKPSVIKHGAEPVAQKHVRIAAPERGPGDAGGVVGNRRNNGLRAKRHTGGLQSSRNTVHFAIRMAALKSMRVVGCGVRGRNG